MRSPQDQVDTIKAPNWRLTATREIGDSFSTPFFPAEAATCSRSGGMSTLPLVPAVDGCDQLQRWPSRGCLVVAFFQRVGNILSGRGQALLSLPGTRGLVEAKQPWQGSLQQGKVRQSPLRLG